MKFLEDIKKKEIESLINVAYEVKKIPPRERQKLYMEGVLTKEIIRMSEDANRAFPERLRERATKKIEKKYAKLQARVNSKVGRITKIREFANGYDIEGTKGFATLEIISAGGYNIQCLHHRVLIK